ncbi:HmuY family protein [Olivibacter sitiensis]|uniref:HmuY family protein n=1 Tax=Olivibacter sitiensis TaxID=376470 RepID=UPI000424F069|nr:HmuY family protein [Olivibacter sitiensis]
MKKTLVLLLMLTGKFTFAQEVKTQTNLDAGNGMVLFNLAKGRIVEASKLQTADWDIAFQKTTILFNSGSSGPGKTSAQLVGSSFEQLTKAPEDGYKSDTESTKAIPTGSGNGWYVYDMEGHTITPIPHKTIVVRTETGKHYKLEILSYNKDQKPYEQSGYYSFRFAPLGK